MDKYIDDKGIEKWKFPDWCLNATCYKNKACGFLMVGTAWASLTEKWPKPLIWLRPYVSKEKKYLLHELYSKNDNGCLYVESFEIEFSDLVREWIPLDSDFQPIVRL